MKKHLITSVAFQLYLEEGDVFPFVAEPAGLKFQFSRLFISILFTFSPLVSDAPTISQIF